MTEKAAYERYTGNLREALNVYFVMGSPNCGGRDPAAVLRAALEGGVTLFQFREKGPGALQGQERTELGRKLLGVCRQAGVPFIVNDDLRLAEELEADGIHVGQEDLAQSDRAGLRQRFKGRILGISAHDPAEAREAVRCGADYIGAGPMYATATKPDARAVQGPGIISDMRAGGITLPLAGIGGITPEGAAAVLAAGADGVAVISAIGGADDPREAARRFSRLFTG
ncbi:thiamine phosphate synthase [Paenibacillus sp. 1P03SA]|uniref:thiamine phosphate synthase n=1 Tax=Paenibacillus sp. 1P03SA TaxID=3132294 RepID=UPI0039A296BB